MEERGISNLSYMVSPEDNELHSAENGSSVRFRVQSPRSPSLRINTGNDDRFPPRPPTVPGLFDNAKPRHPPPRMDVPTSNRVVDFSSQIIEKRNDEAEEEDPRSCKNVTKKVISVFMAYAGPFLMALAYMIAGGYLFNYLEEGNERAACFTLESEYRAKLNESVERTLSFAMSGFNESVTRDKLEEALKKFAKDMYVISFDPAKECALLGTPGHLYDWNVLNAMFFCVTIMTTIGYGHISPKSYWGKIVLMVYSVLGIPIMVVFLTNVGDALASLFRSVYINFCCLRCFLKRKRVVEVDEPQEVTMESTKGPPPKVGDIIIVEEDEEDDSDEYVTIPISVVCVFLVAYMLLGSGLFRIWEKDWSLLDGTYFSFVTISTIGFGDYVPGKDGFDKPETQIEMVVGSFYCLFGLAILSMCLNLIQDEIVAKFMWLGKKLGIISKDEDEEEEEEEESPPQQPQSNGQPDVQIERIQSRELTEIRKEKEIESSQIINDHKVAESSA